MLYVPSYTHEHRPYSVTLVRSSFTLNCHLALRIRAQKTTYGLVFHPGPMSCADILAYKGKMYWCSRDPYRLSVEIRWGCDDDTTALQRVARFDGGGDVLEFKWGGYKGSRPWCSLLVGFPSLFFVPSGERLAPMCWRGTSMSTISRVMVPIIFSEPSVVVDGEGVAFWPKVMVVWRGGVAGCTRISIQ